MRRFLLIIFFIAAIAPVLPGGEPGPSYPVDFAPDPDVKNLRWNRYASKNFSVMSLDDGQGQWLGDNIEKIKTWAITRWGFPDFDFPAGEDPTTRVRTGDCRVMCVSDRDMMKKLFGMEQSSAEVRRKDGKIDSTAAWLILDDKPSRVIPPVITPIIMAEFEFRHNVKLPYFAIRGMACLNAPIPDIRSQLGRITPSMSSSQVFVVTEDQYSKMKPEEKKKFDDHAAAAMLLLRKEFGEAKLQGFLRMSSRNKPDDVIRMIYGFRDYNHFDKSYTRYMRELAADITANKTPDSYLEIRAVRQSN